MVDLKIKTQISKEPKSRRKKIDIRKNNEREKEHIVLIGSIKPKVFFNNKTEKY